MIVFHYGTHILKYLHNYFIMYDIKYINQINQTIQRGQKKFHGKTGLLKILSKNTIFQNLRG
jgi:hypothetical protein